VNYKECESAIALELLVATFCINQIQIPVQPLSIVILRARDGIAKQEYKYVLLKGKAIPLKGREGS
jgi:hypothetical protein